MKSMSNLNRYLFPFLMFSLMLITLLKYSEIRDSEIRDFKSNSKEHSFVVEGKFVDISAMKADLMNRTHQPVDEELVTDGQYKLTFRCPPEKIGLVFSMLDKFNLKGRATIQDQ
jgi:hypothetical protein